MKPGCRGRTIAKVALSAFIVFHLAAVFILPNPDSILYHETQKVVRAYGTMFGIHTTWRFFSPNPLLKVLEYRVIGSKTENAETRHRFPESVKEAGNREGFNRLMTYAMFMAQSHEYLEAHLQPYICAKWPDATSIEYEILGNEFSPIERAQRVGLDRAMLMKQVRNPAGEIECSRKEAPP